MNNIQNVKISVAMATYNGEKYLREQLDSLYAQTLKPFEVVVIDDRSKDNTVEILKEYETKYGLKYIVNEQNMGVNKNFFKAISLCSGEYIAICDQDDIWFKNKIEITAQKLFEIEEDLPAAVSSQVVDVDKNGNIIQKAINTKEDSFGYAASLLDIGNGQGCTLMLNKPAVDVVLSTYNDNCSNVMYDVFINFTIALIGKKYNLGIPLMYYRHHESNVLAKEQKSKLSISERIKAKPTYVDFIPDVRFKSIPLVYNQCYTQVSNPNIIKLVQKIEEIRECNFLKGLVIICGIQELSLKRRLNICVKSMCIGILKLMVSK